MTLTPSSIRQDLKCGKGAISKGEKCHKGPSTATKIAVGVGLTAGALALGGLAARRGRTSRPTAKPASSTPPESDQPRLPGLTPKALIAPGAPRRSKTQRMRENTATAVRNAEGRIAQTAREEVRRVAQIGNTMAATGEATGMAAKTTFREVRLRVEAARRRFEPGYRAPDQRRLPAGLEAPLSLQAVAPEREAIPLDPRTGQPRRRKTRGFGRGDSTSGHQFFSPYYLDPAASRGDGPSTDYYRSHPKARAKKVRHQAEINRRPEEKDRRVSLTRERRRRGIDGKGGPDVSHTKSGGTVLEDASTNRARNGAGGKAKLKADSTWAVGFDAEDGKKYTKTVTNPETGRKNKVRYGAKGYTIAPGTDKGDRYCARSFGDMKAHGKDCSGPDRNTPLCLSRAKWKCSGKTSR